MGPVMTVYKNGRGIGEIRDFGVGRIMAYDFTESDRIGLGFFPTRKAAREAIEARHDPL